MSSFRFASEVRAASKAVVVDTFSAESATCSDYGWAPAALLPCSGDRRTRADQ